jgi:hypothetical protein
VLGIGLGIKKHVQNFEGEIIILYVVLYGCETWSFTLGEKHGLRTFEKKVLRKNLDVRGRKRQEAGEDCIMKSFVTCNLHQILLG